MFKKVFLFILLLVLYLDFRGQTVVIAYKTKDAIYVGADSRKTGYEYKFKITGLPSQRGGIVKRDTSSMCKIVTVGEKFNMAFLGWNIEESIAAGKKACSESQTFDEAIDKYINSYGKYLSGKLWAYYSTNKSLYDSIVSNRRNSISEVLFFGYEADTAFTALVILTVKDDPLWVEIVPIVGNNNPLFGGHISEIYQELKDETIWNEGPIPVINRLIKKQSENHPLSVGEPIDILKVTEKGRTWVQRKQMCE